MSDDRHGKPEESDPNAGFTEHLGDDRALWEPEATTPRAFKLIQGYLWHPRDQQPDLAAHLPATLGPEVHLLLDAMPAAPFTFFDDGTLSATQVVYQLTVLAIVQPGQRPDELLAEAAERLKEHLDTTPEGVGWQLMSDLREVD